MDGAAGALLLSVGVLAVVGVAWLLAHNRFVQQRQHLHESWRDVDVELRRRHDLIPGLVAVVSAGAAHEQSLIALLTSERGLLAGPVALVAERYPGLSSAGNFLALQRQLVETEDRLAAARRIYNSNVERYNERLQSVPTSLVGRRGGFAPAGYYDLAGDPPPAITR